MNEYTHLRQSESKIWRVAQYWSLVLLGNVNVFPVGTLFGVVVDGGRVGGAGDVDGEDVRVSLYGCLIELLWFLSQLFQGSLLWPFG